MRLEKVFGLSTRDQQLKKKLKQARDYAVLLLDLSTQSEILSHNP